MKTLHLTIALLAVAIGASLLAAATPRTATLKRLPPVNTIQLTSVRLQAEEQLPAPLATPLMETTAGAAFTSYRGLGFMGSCCEIPNPCAANLWDGYNPYVCDHPSLFDHMRGMLHSHRGCGKGDCAKMPVSCEQKAPRHVKLCPPPCDVRKCLPKTDCHVQKFLPKPPQTCCEKAPRPAPQCHVQKRLPKIDCHVKPDCCTKGGWMPAAPHWQKNVLPKSHDGYLPLLREPRNGINGDNADPAPLYPPPPAAYRQPTINLSDIEPPLLPGDQST
jgi:hypothetical protein